MCVCVCVSVILFVIGEEAGYLGEMEVHQLIRLTDEPVSCSHTCWPGHTCWAVRIHVCLCVCVCVCWNNDAAVCPLVLAAEVASHLCLAAFPAAPPSSALTHIELPLADVHMDSHIRTHAH